MGGRNNLPRRRPPVATPMKPYETVQPHHLMGARPRRQGSGHPYKTRQIPMPTSLSRWVRVIGSLPGRLAGKIIAAEARP